MPESLVAPLWSVSLDTGDDEVARAVDGVAERVQQLQAAVQHAAGEGVQLDGRQRLLIAHLTRQERVPCTVSSLIVTTTRAGAGES